MGLRFVATWAATLVLFALMVGIAVRLQLTYRDIRYAKYTPLVFWIACFWYPSVGVKLLWREQNVQRRQRAVLCVRWVLWCYRYLPITVGSACRWVHDPVQGVARVYAVWRQLAMSSI